MEWVFYIDNRQYRASYIDDIYSTDSTLLGMVIDRLIKDQAQVRAGYFGPLRPASLASEESAWGTITRAVRMISGDTRNSFPVASFGLEPNYSVD